MEGGMNKNNEFLKKKLKFYPEPADSLSLSLSYLHLIIFLQKNFIQKPAKPGELGVREWRIPVPYSLLPKWLLTIPELWDEK
jgi:hypothetical protein